MPVLRAAVWLTFAVTLTGVTPTLRAQLYTENFDANHAAAWTLNPGPSDNTADFFFDYSTLGIPSAPNSGGSTRGMMLAANLFTGYSAAHGLSVSPIGKSFTGDYSLSFDLWSNYLGNRTGGVGVGADGSTMLSTFGIMSSGAVANYPGQADGLFFAATGDGGSAFDYRAYSSERPISYQVPAPPPGEPNYSPADEHATHYAGGRNNTDALYTTNFGGVTVPAAQTNLFPDTQFGTTPLGSLGFQWHRVEIAKIGAAVSWSIDGVTLITVETADFLVPAGGTNILFGHSDTNGNAGVDPNYDNTSFTLIDNIVVNRILLGDANHDGRVDGRDLLAVERNAGETAPLNGTLLMGDANHDGSVDAADLRAVERYFGDTLLPTSQPIPEPASLLAPLLACAWSAARRPRG